MNYLQVLDQYVEANYWQPGYAEGDQGTPPFNVLDTVISEYANSPTLVQLVNNMGQYIDPTADLEAFYNMVWNVETAQGFGLDIWGKIVGVSRQLDILGDQTYLGFDEGVSYQPFGQAPFYPGEASSTVYTLTDDAYRTLIYVKALANISNCTARSLNQLLQNLFAGRGRCYVADTGQMQMRFVFEFALLPYEISIMTKSGAIPRPAAVQAQVLQVDIPGTFGFSEAVLSQPFGSGVFFNPTVGLLNAS